jgi:hypothetical protein
LDNDVYRLAVSVEGKGWFAQLRNALAAVKFGGSQTVPVYVTAAPVSAASAKVALTAQSESDPTKSATSVAIVYAPERNR